MQTIASPPTIVGVVGLGVMGGAMASHLLRAGYTVLGYDTDPARLAEHTARGGVAAASCEEVADRAEVVLTSLPSVAALEQVAGKDSGLAGADHPGLVAAETSTLPLEAKERARQALAARGVTLLDCPLSGTGAQAQTGDLSVYASGEPQALAYAAPVLDAFTRSRYDVGPFGTGMKLKVIANHLVAIHNVAAAEAMLLAKRSGLDPELVLRTITDGAGTSRMLEIRGPVMAAGDYSVPGMRVELFAKDIDIISAFARAHASPTPLLAVTGQLYTAALAQGRSDQEAACVLAVLEQLTSQPDDGPRPEEGD
jgi:putative dehydrogenase